MSPRHPLLQRLRLRRNNRIDISTLAKPRREHKIRNGCKVARAVLSRQRLTASRTGQSTPTRYLSELLEAIARSDQVGLPDLLSNGRAEIGAGRGSFIEDSGVRVAIPLVTLVLLELEIQCASGFFGVIALENRMAGSQ